MIGAIAWVKTRNQHTITVEADILLNPVEIDVKIGFVLDQLNSTAVAMIAMKRSGVQYRLLNTQEGWFAVLNVYGT